MTIWDFIDKHPVWALVYLLIIAIQLPSAVFAWRCRGTLKPLAKGGIVPHAMPAVGTVHYPGRYT